MTKYLILQSLVTLKQNSREQMLKEQQRGPCRYRSVLLRGYLEALKDIEFMLQTGVPLTSMGERSGYVKRVDFN